MDLPGLPRLRLSGADDARLSASAIPAWKKTLLRFQALLPQYEESEYGPAQPDLRKPVSLLKYHFLEHLEAKLKDVLAPLYSDLRSLHFRLLELEENSKQ